LISSLIQIFFLPRQYLPHTVRPFFFTWAEKTTSFPNRLAWTSTIVCYYRNSWIHRFTRNYSEMLILRSVEYTLCISQEIFSCFIRNCSIEVNILLYCQFICNLFKLFFVFNIFSHF
jgi:hypothetical protein